MSKKSAWEKFTETFNGKLIKSAPKKERKHLLFIASGGKRGKKKK